MKYRGTQFTDEKFITAKQALALARSSRCVFCGRSDVSYDDTNFDSGVATQHAYCLDCNKNWWESYELKYVIEPLAEEVK